MSEARILVVDDDQMLLDALPDMLRLRAPDVAVDTCAVASAALRCLEAVQYDVVISDIKMPDMDGLALLEQIHARWPEVLVIFVTGHGERDLVVSALRGGAFDFIYKPIDREYFIIALRRALEMHALRRHVEVQRLALEQHAASLEKTVAERTRELREANAIKELVLSIAAHELRNPLAALNLQAQLSYRELQRVGIAEARHLAEMERTIHRLVILVNDLVDTACMTSGKLSIVQRPCNVVALAQRVTKEQAALLGGRIAFSARVERLMVHADEDRLSQVLINLLANAFKHSLADTEVQVTVEHRGGDAVLSVRDHGEGIPPEHVPYIFDRFYQVNTEPSRMYTGLGLGLYICQEIVEQHGGRIWVESERGQGSTFFATFPVVLPAKTAAGSERKYARAVRGS